ncbi:hypothetical protein J2847_002665 [Azospirillum agricola]|uniref:hypothetical protein n=1 Tax=Azospirillum agricola TaxID=1720247 RepID=UPI001AE20CF8|nr:hypothetical protein [Azospirillum agricola]MBP2229371.1 hypothetical protein [Azospirillum agricola]
MEREKALHSDKNGRRKRHFQALAVEKARICSFFRSLLRLSATRIGMAQPDQVRRGQQTLVYPVQR